MGDNMDEEKTTLQDIFDELTSDDDELYKLLREFFSYENIDTKTEIPKSKLIKILRVLFYAKALKEYIPEVSNDINEMVQIYERLMISYNRKGRKELFDALKGSEVKEGKGLLSFLKRNKEQL